MVPPIGPNQYSRIGREDINLYRVVGNDDISYKNTLNALVHLFEIHPYLAKEGILVTVNPGSGSVPRGTYVIKPERVATEGEELELKVYRQGEDNPTDINVDVLFRDGITNETAGRKRMKSLIATLAGVEENGLKREVIDLGLLYHDYSASIAARSEDDRIAFVKQRVSVHTNERYRLDFAATFIFSVVENGSSCTEAEEGLPFCGATIEGILGKVGDRYELTSEREAYREAAEEANRIYASARSEGTGWREAYEAAENALDKYQEFKDAYQFVETLVQTERGKAVRDNLLHLSYIDLQRIAAGDNTVVLEITGSVDYGSESYDIAEHYTCSDVKALIDGDADLNATFGRLLRGKIINGHPVTITDEVKPYLALALEDNQRVVTSYFDNAHHVYLIQEDSGVWTALNDDSVVIAEDAGVFTVKPNRPLARKHEVAILVAPEAPASAVATTTTTNTGTSTVPAEAVPTDFHAFEPIIKRHGLNGAGATLFADLFDDGKAEVNGVAVDLTNGIDSAEWQALGLGTQEAFALWSVGGDASKVKNGNVVGDGNVTAQDQNDMYARTISLVAGGVGVNPAELKDIEAQYLASTEWLVVDYEEATARLLNGAEFINATEVLSNVKPALRTYVLQVLRNVAGKDADYTFTDDDKLFVNQLNSMFASMVFLLQIENPADVLGIAADPMGVKLETGSVNELMEALFGDEGVSTFVADRGLVVEEKRPSAPAAATVSTVDAAASDNPLAEGAEAIEEGRTDDAVVLLEEAVDRGDLDEMQSVSARYSLAFSYYQRGVMGFSAVLDAALEDNFETLRDGVISDLSRAQELATELAPELSNLIVDAEGTTQHAQYSQMLNGTGEDAIGGGGIEEIRECAVLADVQNLDREKAILQKLVIKELPAIQKKMAPYVDETTGGLRPLDDEAKTGLLTKIDEIIVDVKKALGLYPNSEEIHGVMFQLAMWRGAIAGNYDESIAFYEEFIATHPTSVEAKRSLMILSSFQADLKQRLADSSGASGSMRTQLREEAEQARSRAQELGKDLLPHYQGRLVEKEREIEANDDASRIEELGREKDYLEQQVAMAEALSQGMSLSGNVMDPETLAVMETAQDFVGDVNKARNNGGGGTARVDRGGNSTGGSTHRTNGGSQSGSAPDASDFFGGSDDGAQGAINGR
ncbi:MAG: hypothetical protein KKB81_00430 [Candidatus Margulisbacteria bacterium]|nr:hypothetical protein [Candidatus Margulisiibacteriota bacterium]MBU1022422.1 hypothetical protein [Candidatus Margulisiibacteriota bacterium]MBU1954553.1 hypothetical protein [Candidatus Margulisiibacteriota bacterium]